MRSLFILGAAFVALAGAAMAETRTHSSFTGVSTSDRIPVEVTLGESYRVEVLGSDAERVRTEVDDGVLEVRQRNRPWFGGPPRIDARVRVTAPAIDSLAASRGGSIRAEGMRANSMSLAASMGGDIDVSGTCGALSAAASMGGSIDADSLECETARIAASMGGDAKVFASNSYNASASMGGSVRVGGNPQRGDVSTTMGGAVSTP